MTIFDKQDFKFCCMIRKTWLALDAGYRIGWGGFQCCKDLPVLTNATIAGHLRHVSVFQYGEDAQDVVAIK